MIRRLPLVAILVSLVASVVDARQATTPQLSKPQRETLRNIVAAVEQASVAPGTPDVTWPVHVMRASDGSHYVAFSLVPAEDPLPTGPFVLYVRLATAPLSSAQSISERSSVGEWLAGQRSDPLMKPKTGIAPGEMPNFGAGAIAARGSTASSGSTDLKLMAMERERARQEKEDRDRQRRRELDGAERASINLLPFEDFEVNAVVPTGTRAIQRALTAGPGDYTLYVAWADPAAKPPGAVHVVQRSLHLPPATTVALSLSSIIVADRIGVRPVPYSPVEQRAHPYTIGSTDITPAADAIFTRDEQIAVAFQVINARASDTGKPNVDINFRIVRLTQDREQQVASLTPQKYDEGSMPPDFDLRLGHPIFATVAAPLATLARGDYRLKVLVSDRISGTSTAADTDFIVVGTPATLLAEAPSVGRPFKHESALVPDALQSVVAGMRPATPSATLGRALDHAQKGQFIELLREEPVDTGEQGVRTVLTALAFYSVGDASSASMQLQRAAQQNAPAGPVQYLLGAVRALQVRDDEAIAAWQAAIEAGLPAQMITRFLVEAHLRRGEPAKAAALLTSSSGESKDGLLTRAQAAVHIASGREADAIPLLRSRLASQPDDRDAEWLLIHALFASVVRAPAGTTSPNVEPFKIAARAYVEKHGANAALASEWLKVIAK